MGKNQHIQLHLYHGTYWCKKDNLYMIYMVLLLGSHPNLFIPALYNFGTLFLKILFSWASTACVLGHVLHFLWWIRAWEPIEHHIKKYNVTPSLDITNTTSPSVVLAYLVIFSDSCHIYQVALANLGPDCPEFDRSDFVGHVPLCHVSSSFWLVPIRRRLGSQ